MDRPFEVLGILPTLDPEEVRKAYHQKARVCHPDQFSDPGEQEKANAEMVRINQAYEEAMHLVNTRAVSPYLQMLNCRDAVELADRLMRQGSPERALRQLMRAEGRDASWYDAQGRVMMALEQFETAEQSFRQAVRMDPDNLQYRRGALDAIVARRKARTLQGRIQRLLRPNRAREHSSK